MKRFIFFLLISFSLLSVVSCGDDETTVAVAGLSLDKESATLELGMTLTLTASVTPEDATDKTVLWSSNDETIATVIDGKVSAVSIGEATITAKAGDKTAECKISVIPENLYVAKAFSVSETKQVYFSGGNLQYHCKNKEWRFAPLQYDRIGNDNAKINDTYNGYIDLFGWGTGSNPTLISENENDYVYFTDWGKNIDDGNTWRTLSVDEWSYIINKRDNSSDKQGVAEVAGVNGLVLLPDEWILPDGVSFKVGFGIEFRNKNVYSYEDWQKMEKAGAVFLPAADNRVSRTVEAINIKGYYWSCTAHLIDNALAWSLFFRPYDANPYYDFYRYMGQSVRLVRDL